MRELTRHPDAHAEAAGAAPAARRCCAATGRLHVPRAAGAARGRRAARRRRLGAPDARGARRRCGGSAPASEQPLAEVRLVLDGDRLVAQSDACASIRARARWCWTSTRGGPRSRPHAPTLVTGLVRPLAPPAERPRSGSSAPRVGRGPGAVGDGGRRLRARGRDRSDLRGGVEQPGAAPAPHGPLRRGAARRYRRRSARTTAAARRRTTSGSLARGPGRFDEAIALVPPRAGARARLRRRPLQSGRRARASCGPRRRRRSSTGAATSSSTRQPVGRASRARTSKCSSDPAIDRSRPTD